MTGHRLHFNDSKKSLALYWAKSGSSQLGLHCVSHTHTHTRLHASLSSFHWPDKPSQFGGLFNVQNFQFLPLTFHCSAASRILTYYSPHLCLTYLWAVMSLEPGRQTDYFDALINQSFNLSVIWLTLLHLKSNACAELVICTSLSWRIWKSSTPPVSIKSLFRTASENPINLIHKHVMQGKSPLTKQTLQLLAKMSLVFLFMIKLLLAVPFYTRGHMFGALPDGLQRDLCPPSQNRTGNRWLVGWTCKTANSSKITHSNLTWPCTAVADLYSIKGGKGGGYTILDSHTWLSHTVKTG